MLEAVEFTSRFMELSWVWLRDEETRRLTMTPVFTRKAQRDWFLSLTTRADYLIWGLQLDGVPIGAFGIKNIRDFAGEYWGYIGEKRLWGKGLGKDIITLAESKARGLGLKHLNLRVSPDNERAIRLYFSVGFRLEVAAEDAMILSKAL